MRKMDNKNKFCYYFVSDYDNLNFIEFQKFTK